jgi:hypothetical protein
VADDDPPPPTAPRIRDYEVTGTPVVARSSLIETLAQAVSFHRARLAGDRLIDVRGKPAIIHFERNATHHFTEGHADERGNVKWDAKAEPLENMVLDANDNLRRFVARRAVVIDEIHGTVSAVDASLNGRDGHWDIWTKINARPFLVVLEKVKREGEVPGFRVVTVIPKPLQDFEGAVKKRHSPKAKKFP